MFAIYQHKLEWYGQARDSRQNENSALTPKRLTPYFLPVGDGFRFCIFHEAQTHQAKGAVLYLHPFAEEMNKSRRMVAMQARALAQAGYDVLQIDLLGCGDSSGNFGDTTWAAWRHDVLAAYHDLRMRSQAPLTLWGLRSGCLLAASAAVDLPEIANFIFWQPVISGKQHWQQFMRLKMAGELSSGQSIGVTEHLKQSLAAGQPVEIAGYTVAPGLAHGLESADLSLLERTSGSVILLELSNRPDAELTPVAQKRIQEWRATGIKVEAVVVSGPAFWQTSEIEEVPELLTATLLALGGWA